jgi:hypothetical protein
MTPLKIGSLRFASILLVCLIALTGCKQSHPAHADQHPDNGVWLGHAYVTTSSYVDAVPDLASDMKQNYHVLYWFVNVGFLNGSGQVIGGSGGLSQAVHFLNALHKWESADGYTFKVLAMINGSLDSKNANYLDLSSSAVRQSIANESKKFVSTAATGSYIAGANRAFDGVQLDLEPSGLDETRFNNIKNLMDDVHNAINPYGNKLTSFTAPKYGANSNWSWSPEFYYQMARHVDLLAAMTYDTGIKTSAKYQNWMTNQTVQILQAVSGKYWNNDAAHPIPTNGVKVLLGFPAFATKPHHDPAVENIKFAAPAVNAGLNNLASTGDPSLNYFQGAAVYLMADGTGAGGYANKTTDWWWFGHYWLGAW